MKFVFAVVVCCVFLRFVFSSQLDKKDADGNLESRQSNKECVALGKQCSWGNECCSDGFCMSEQAGIAPTCKNCIAFDEQCVFGFEGLRCCRGSFCMLKPGETTLTCAKCAAHGEHCGRIGNYPRCCMDGRCDREQGETTTTCKKCIAAGQFCNSNILENYCCDPNYCTAGKCKSPFGWILDLNPPPGLTSYIVK